MASAQATTVTTACLPPATRFREAKNLWPGFEEPGILDIELSKGLKISVAGAKIGRKTPCANEVVRWGYLVGEPGYALVLEIVLQEATRSWLAQPAFYARLNPEQRRWMNMLTAAFALAAVGAAAGLIYVLLNYPGPDWFWSFIGRNVRLGVGLILFLMLVGVALVATKALRSPLTILNVFWVQFGLLAGIAAWLEWYAVISVPPAGLVPDVQPIAYLDHLVGKYQTALPVLLAALSSLSLALAVLGKEGWVKVIDKVAKQGKP